MKKVKLLLITFVLVILITACHRTSRLTTTTSINVRSTTTTETIDWDNVKINDELYINRQLNEILGVTHTSGKYFFSNKDFLNEGADIIEVMGINTIKLWLTPNPDVSYNYNTIWPKSTNLGIDSGYPEGWNKLPEYQNAKINSLVDLLKTSYYQDVLAKDRNFTTYVFETTEFKSFNWKSGLSPYEINEIKRQFKEVTIYLMESQKGTGRTFLLQNWEGDNAIRFFEGSWTAEQEQLATEGMIKWLNARQDGITEGRNYVLAKDKDNDVKVYGVAEVNRVNSSNETFKHKLVIDYVVPHTHMDLYSLSSWGTRLPGEEQSLIEKLDYIAEKAPDNDIFGDKNVILGEFGAYMQTYESQNNNYPGLYGYSGDGQYMANRKQLEFALDWGIQYALYWQVYCNGWRNYDCSMPGVCEPGPYLGPNNEEQLVAKPNQLRGVWLVTESGTRVPTWYYFYNELEKQYINDELKYMNKFYAYTSGIKLIQDFSISTLDYSFVVNEGDKAETIIYKTRKGINDFALKVFYDKSKVEDVMKYIRVYVSSDNVEYQEVSTSFRQNTFIQHDIISGHIVPTSYISSEPTYIKIVIYPNTKNMLRIGGVMVNSLSEDFNDLAGSPFFVKKSDGFTITSKENIEDKSLFTVSAATNSLVESLIFRYTFLNNYKLPIYFSTDNLETFNINDYLYIQYTRDAEKVSLGEKNWISISSKLVNVEKVTDNLYRAELINAEEPKLFITYLKVNLKQAGYGKVFIGGIQLENKYIRPLEITLLSVNKVLEELDYAYTSFKFDKDSEFELLLNDPNIKVNGYISNNAFNYELSINTYQKKFVFKK